jgi:hypothetical protein
MDIFGHPGKLIEDKEALYYTLPINFGKWFLAMMLFVPISLIVSLEMVKFI